MSHTGQSAREKGDRALELHEKGVATDAIAARLGLRNLDAVHHAISKARSRREKAKEGVE
jgi:hypothetical protein